MVPQSAQPLAPRRGQRIALGVLVALAFVVVAWMVAPLLVGLALGTVMAFAAQPLHERIATGTRGRRRIAAAVTTLLGGLLMAGGGVAAVWRIAREMVSAVALVQQKLSVAPWPYVSLVAARLRDELGRAANLAAQGATVVVRTSTGVLLTIVVALWTMYYVLVDWPRIEAHLEHLLPLDPRHTRALVAEFREVGRRAFVGAVATAVVQGTLAGAGFAMVGVPQPMTWGAVLAVTSFIPVVGTLLVWVPACAWLVSNGHVGGALVLAGWCLVIVMAASDYVIRPRLVGSGGDAHPLLMLVSMLGGISMFGVAGIIVGPVIMSLFVAAARIYEREQEAE